jgi:nitrite reductase/ring-hydroxylating ferredoxin subunit
MLPNESCGAADACGRRTFLREGAAALAVAAFLGRDVFALPVDLVTALSRTGSLVKYPIPASDGVTIDRDQDVIVVRSAGRVMAFALTCPHQNTALRWQEKAGEFQCPKHKSRYKPDGVFITGRATRAMDRFAITREGESVVVDLDKLYKADEQAAAWDAAAVRV